jgi:hypothetical protein
MKTGRNLAVLIVVSVLAGWGYGQNGQVKFRGTVTVDEQNNVIPVCYGDYHVTVAIERILGDPNGVLTLADSVQVCYESALHLASGDAVEVYGYYWGGICPKQYCNRVQILGKFDYIVLVEESGDNDWMVIGNDMHSIPSGNVGIGASQPQEKLHVVGNMLLEAASPVWMRLVGDFRDDAGISLTTAGVGVNTWEILRQGASADLLIAERFPYPPFSGGRVVVKAGSGNVGIGTTEPEGKLHVLGDVRIEVAPDDVVRAPIAIAASTVPLTVVKEGAGRQLLAYFSNPRDGAVEAEIQLAGGKMLPWGWSMRAASGLFSLGSVMVFPPALNIKSTGYLGLGVTNPSYRLELPNTANAGGRGRANAWTTYSSARWKTNVRAIDHAMDKVRQLRGVYFDWKESGRHDVGLVAEEVGRVMPEVVDYEANGIDASSLAYDRLVALLVEALKGQEARIAELEQALAQRDRLKQRVDALERLVQQQAIRTEPQRVCKHPVSK